MISLLACLLLGLRDPQTLSKPITLEVLSAPLWQVAKQIEAQTGVKIRVVSPGQELSTTVLVWNQPLGAVLKGLASLHDLTLNLESDPITLIRTDKQAILKEYLFEEDRLLGAIAGRRLQALADLTKDRFSEQPRSGQLEPDQTSDDKSWALKRIGQWPFYLAGMWKRLPVLRPGGSNPDLWAAFWVGAPENQNQQRWGASWIDEASSELADFQICLRVQSISGQLQVAGVYPSIELPEKPYRYPYAFVSPPKELAATQFARKLALWQTPIENSAEPILVTPSKKTDTSSPEKWFQDSESMADVLYAYCKPMKVPVMADAFRIAARAPGNEIGGETVGEWLKAFKLKEDCFVRLQDGIVLVRHPGYWRLQQTEPERESISEIEEKAAKRKLNLLDYAKFVASNSPEMQVRFDCNESALTKFDPTPIQESGPALRSLGLIPAGQLARFLRGERYWGPYDGFEVSKHGSDRADFIGASKNGPFYGASVQGVSRLILQGPNGYAASRGYYDLLGSDYPFKFESAAFGQIVINDSLTEAQMSFGFTYLDKVTYNLRVP